MSGLWYEVTAVTHKDDAEVKDIGGSKVYIRGAVDGLLIIQVPKGCNHQEVLTGIQRMLQAENIDKGVFVLDDSIEMMKLEPVPRQQARDMEAKHQAAKVAKLARSKQNAPTTSTKQ
ncbi:MAG: hypothetical protein JRG69_01830 [Deltaproteobacteria bacterium]|nr:hypothetical protein [Deltaproteobacteria bacterium]